MSVTVVFLADPPQYARDPQTVGIAATPSYPYQVGDRVSVRNTGNNTTYTYTCTVAGTSGGSAFQPDGASPTTWGTTTWTLVTPNSWANAATMLYEDAVNYVDCEARGVFQSVPYTFQFSTQGALAVVFVSQDMKPSNGAPVGTTTGWPTPDGGTPVFFPPMSGAGFHGRSRLGFPLQGIRTDDPQIDMIGEVGGVASQARYVRGARLTYAGSGSAASISSFGHAVTQVLSGLASLSLLPNKTIISEGDAPFGAHVSHNLVSSQLPAPSYEVAQGLLYRPSTAYISDNDFTPTPYARGMQCVLVRSTAVYRNGAAPASDGDQSFLFGGATGCSYPMMRVSPWLFVQNNLTGARTLTLHLLTDSPFTNDITDADFWIEAFYPSSATTPQYSLATSENPNWGVPMASTTPLTTDAATWTYSGVIAQPTAFKIALAITPQRIGMIFLRAMMASFKLSRYVTYLCPYVDIA